MLKVEKAITWRESLRKGSVWLAWAAGTLAASIIAAAPGLIVQALTAPFGTRIVIGLLIGIAIAAAAWSSRVLSVTKKGKGDGQAA